MTTRRAALLIVAMLICCACAPAMMLSAPPNAPSDVVAGCEIANHRCSHCHTLERIKLARVSDAVQWQWYVARMRLMPRSGISEPDQRAIVRCLVARSFGNDAVEGLDK
jgi:hypothetical protein